MTRRHRWWLIIPGFVVGIMIPIVIAIAVDQPLPRWLADLLRIGP